MLALAEVGRRRPAPPPFEATPILSHTTTTFPNQICATGAGGRPMILGIEWDAENRLIATNQGTHRSEFTYDGESRRVRIIEKDNGSVTSDRRYVWCGLKICEQRDGAGTTVQRRFISQGFLEGTNKYFYAKDHLGSIRETTDNAGTIQVRMNYDPYGRPNSTIGNPTWGTFGYTGHLHHWDSGAILAPYRGYNAAYGRWISEDPIGLRGGQNRYLYVHNRPSSSVDPSGLVSSCAPVSCPAPPVPQPTKRSLCFKRAYQDYEICILRAEVRGGTLRSECMEKYANCVFMFGTTICFMYRLCLASANEVEAALTRACNQQLIDDLAACDQQPGPLPPRWIPPPTCTI